MADPLNYRLPRGTKITREIAVKAPQATWEMVQRELSRNDFIDAAEELADFFQTAANAAREDEEAGI